MKSEINELIEFYESEVIYLEACIAENLKDNEYLIADFHSKALQQVNSQLHKIKKLKYPFYDEIADLKRQIQMYLRFDTDKPIEHKDTYYKKEIAELNAKMQLLQNKNNQLLYDEQKIDDALFRLKNGVNNGFILWLNAKDNLSFTFDLVNHNALNIEIGLRSVLNIDYYFDDDFVDVEEFRILNMFYNLGFELNSAKNKLVYKYDMKTFKDAGSIKVLLSRIIYEILYFTTLDKPASLIYY